MAANFCLPKDRVDAFTNALKEGKIKPDELRAMDSATRNQFFTDIVGDAKTAQLVNAEFESKLLLKHQEEGFIRWAKSVQGVTQQARRDMVTKIKNLDRVLTPTEEDQFLNELANKKLGFEVTEAEAKAITDKSALIRELEQLKRPDGTFPSEAKRLEYGRAVVDMTDYVSGLKNNAEKLRLSDLKNPGKYGEIATKGAGNLKSIQASLDNSAIFRQGWKTLWTNPGKWSKNAVKTWGYIAKELRGKDVLKEVNADIISRPNFDRYAKAKLAVYKAEEAFPESAPEKIPGLGRLFKASESAYTGFVYRLRADIFDQYLKHAESMGINIDDPQQLQAIGKVANSLTGRASLGSAERAGSLVNNFFFSPRFIKSNFDVLTAHTFSKEMTPFARKKAATNLVKAVAGTAMVLYTAEALRPGSVDWDPRSTDFGKIKIGNTRFDVTGGMGSLVVLASRLMTGQSKTQSGQIKSLKDGGYGAQDQIDVLTTFIRNKLSPAAAMTVNIATGKDSLGNPVTPIEGIIKGVTPIGIQNANQSFEDPNSANDLAVIIADGLGISTSNYGPKSANSWAGNSSKELKQFKQKVGDDTFKKANTEFANQYSEFVNKMIKNSQYMKLSDDDKQKLLNKKQADLKSKIFKKYNFTYKQQKSDTNTINSLIK